MGLPNKLYYIKTTKKALAGNFGEKSGGKYTDLDAAITQIDRIRKRGGDAELYETTCDWRDITPPANTLTKEQARTIFEQAAYRNCGMTGDAFIAKWNSGWGRKNVYAERVAMLLPLI